MNDYFIHEFKLPIDFIENTYILDNNVIKDLEIDSHITSPYNYLSIPNYNKKSKINEIHKILFDKFYLKYTTNTSYLKDIQNILQEYTIQKENDEHYFTEWKNNINDKSILDKHQYITWDHIKFLNTSPKFLQTMTLYNLSSPLFNLFMPFLFLIFPFFIIRFVMKVPITFQNYKDTLTAQFKNHAIGKLFNLFSSDINSNKKLYILFSIGFYFFTIYQNLLSCIKFYSSIQYINEFLYKTKQHILHTLSHIKYLIQIMKPRKSLASYIEYLREKKNEITLFYQELSILENPNFKIKDVFHVGGYLQLFYKITQQEKYHTLLFYTFGIQSLISYFNGFKHLINTNKISKCTFHKTTTKLSNQYFPHLVDTKPVKNSIQIKNSIITGPNASGKTTILKSSILNILFSQQIGYGFYDEKTKINPFDYIHSYINIPDTSERDSLFQAEARRCLHIIHSIQENKNKKHFIIFDELYSGTNSTEAVSIAKSFLEYLQQYKVSYLLTTHFKELTDIEKIKNLYLDVKLNKNKYLFTYTYKLKKGISTIKGGYKVISDLGYPKEILDDIK